MSTLEYSIERFPLWAKEVGAHYTEKGGSPKSYADLVSDWGTILSDAVAAKIWVGGAAKSNYDLFTLVGNDIGNYFNEFTGAFNDAMESVNSSVLKLEQANAVNQGEVTVADSLALTEEQIAQIDELSIETDVVIYNKEEIEALSGKIDSFINDFKDATYQALTLIDKIATGSGTDTTSFVWEGDAATSTHETLKNSIKKNAETIETDLDSVSKKVKLAAETAKSADTVSSSN